MNYEAIAFWSQIVSAIVFYVVLVWLWFKFIAPAVVTAQANKNREIAQAERHRDEAKGALEALTHEIEGAKRDAEAIRSRAGDQAAREAEAMVAQAREAGERAIANASHELERARAAARVEFREELARKALAVARSEAERRVDGSRNAALVDQFVASLERGAKN